MDRAVDIVEIRKKILIVCEGGKTEPQYFKNFRFPGLVLQVEGVGMNTLNLVNKAICYKKHKEYDQVWCVFDKDDFPIDNFENAIQLAIDHGLRVAYSNQAFELWYVLHFEYLNTAIERKVYMKKLDSYLGYDYKKNDPNMYMELLCKREIAIQNAIRLLNEYNPSHPGLDDPSTRVHELVVALLEQAKPLSSR